MAASYVKILGRSLAQRQGPHQQAQGLGQADGGGNEGGQIPGSGGALKQFVFPGRQHLNLGAVGGEAQDGAAQEIQDIHLETGGQSTGEQGRAGIILLGGQVGDAAFGLEGLDLFLPGLETGEQRLPGR